MDIEAPLVLLLFFLSAVKPVTGKAVAFEWLVAE
jgi:hypothetical protein